MSQKKTGQRADKSAEVWSEEQKEDVKDGDGNWANTDRKKAGLQEWTFYQDKVLCGIPVPYADDWNLKGVKVQLFSLGYYHMEKASCATAMPPQLIVDSYVNKCLQGDYRRLNFNYVPHQNLITQSVQMNYHRQLDGTECIFIDCKRIGKDLEETKMQTQ